jgi:hypothetical protein
LALVSNEVAAATPAAEVGGKTTGGAAATVVFGASAGRESRTRSFASVATSALASLFGLLSDSRRSFGRGAAASFAGDELATVGGCAGADAGASDFALFAAAPPDAGAAVTLD